MNKIVCYTLGMIALTVSTAQAQGPAFNLGQGQLLSQTTAVPPAVSPVPMPELAPQPYERHVASQEIPVFDCVKYKRPRNIAPCSNPKLVLIVDPCAPKHSCCEPGCVAVEICAPTCACECVRCTKDGRRKVFDYGKYSVVVESRRGKVTVTYRS
ncbi:hypothetical protein [Gimesia maris]|jgi:hypothetical protein|uniref:hypothetical protein n=1 Tax=Gimesia maris TaxID=122 RepID=UPI001189B345|nr:hypothetical protein [Gimesia maris]QDT79540.1 hypothetical protein Mal35_30040 [Gimesia maris]|tara:strand:- start:851 stop:1315 length:465 start_codon:yes stop_codon:yes gene_type:complete